MNGMDNADMYVDIIDDDDFVPLHGMRIVIGFGAIGRLMSIGCGKPPAPIRQRGAQLRGGL